MVSLSDDTPLDDGALTSICSLAAGGLETLDFFAAQGLRMYTLVRAVQLNPLLSELHVAVPPPSISFRTRVNWVMYDCG